MSEKVSRQGREGEVHQGETERDRRRGVRQRENERRRGTHRVMH